MLNLLMVSLLFCSPIEEDYLLRAVPRDSHFVLYTENIGEFTDSFKSNAWGRFFLFEVWPFLLEYQARLNIRSGSSFSPESKEEYFETVEKFMVYYRKFFASVSGPVASFNSFDSEHQRGPQKSGILVVPGEKKEAFDELIANLTEFYHDAEIFTVSREEYNGTELMVCINSSAPTEDTLTHVLVDTGEVVFFVQHESGRKSAIELARGIIDSLQGKGKRESIIDSPRFLKARAGTGGAGGLEFYINLDFMIPFWIKGERENSELTMPLDDAMAAFGLNDVSAGYLKIEGRDREKLDLTAYIEIEGQGLIRGILDEFVGDAPKLITENAPAEAVSAAALNADLSGIYTRIMATYQAESDTENIPGEEINDVIKKVLGVDLQRDLLEPLDGSFSSYSIAVPEEEVAFIKALFPAFDDPIMNYGSVFLAGLDEPEQFQAGFEKLLRARALHVSLKKEEFQGQEIFSVMLPLLGPRLYWAYSEGQIAISPFPTALRSFLNLGTQKGRSFEKGKHRFGKILDEHKACTFVSVFDTRILLTRLFHFIQEALALESPQTPAPGKTDANDGSTAEAMKFPSPVTISGYFKGTLGLFVEVDELSVRARIAARN